MLRITLLESAGGPLSLRFGYETRVPMQWGPADPAFTVDIQREREALPAEPRNFPLNFEDPDERSVLVPNEVGVHFFGDWRVGTDPAAERAGLIPTFNNERDRVARTWGDYYYSDRNAFGEKIGYALIRIAVPKMPRVEICAANAGGNQVGEWRFRPHEFWRFEELLDAQADVLIKQQPKMRPMPTSPTALDISKLTSEQLQTIAAAIRQLEAAKAEAVSAT